MRLVRTMMILFLAVSGLQAQEGAVVTKQAGPADLNNGEEIYYSVCQACHGDEGLGGAGGGAPLTDALTMAQILNVLKYGQNTMPEFGSIYAETDLRDVATFVLEVLINAE